MSSRIVTLLGLTVVLAACSKNSQTTDGASPPPRDTVRTTQRSDRVVDSTRMDTVTHGKDSTRMRTDSTGQR